MNIDTLNATNEHCMRRQLKQFKRHQKITPKAIKNDDDSKWL